MKTNVMAAALVMIASTSISASATNPFVDVPQDSWAYASIVQLAEADVIQGVDKTYFQGERTITRYEAAEMTAKAMAHMDKASVAQRALINTLADEYAEELTTLGVRIANLENRVGNVKITGDARVRYIYEGKSSDGSGGMKNDDSWTYRIRLRANAKVNDKTTVQMGIGTGNVSFASNKSAADGNDNLFLDLANIKTNLNDHWNITAGRYLYILGNGHGYQYGDAFDGVQLKYTSDKFAATAGYGKFRQADINDIKSGYGELETFFDKGAAGVYYNSFHGHNFYADSLWGAYYRMNLSPKVNILVNYEKINADTYQDPDMWYGKLQYGKADFAVPKTWDVWVEYVDAENGAFLGGSPNNWRGPRLWNNVKSWGAGFDYAIARNTQFQIFQSFASRGNSGNVDPGEATRMQFVVIF